MKRSRILRWFILPTVLVALLLSASGCACGSIQATSWTGMTLKDGKIYVADLEQIQVLGSDGALIQSIVPKDKGAEDSNTAGLIYVAPAIGEDYLIVAGQTLAGRLFSPATNSVVKLDIETGEIIWRFETAKGQYIEGGAISGDTFVIGNSDGYVYALDVATGDLKWTRETDHRVWATPLIAGDTVYIGSMDRNLYALGLSDGEVLWKFPAQGAFASTPVMQNGILYIGTFGNRVYAIDADDGTEVWRFPADEPGDNWFWGSPAVDGDAVYAVDVKGTVYKLNAETGEEIWPSASKLTPKKNDKNAPVRDGPALTEDGNTLLISSQNGSLYALDTADGSQRWSAASDGKGYATPVVDGDVVYETQIHGSYRVRALELLDGGERYSELWVYPPPEE
ncbi:MAG: PQQ-binding-like beta-propeller repeat protein [Anaerolineae bacterium]|nr:PQQ-binding-like beta-propeller repeat protein [Anaerolineae bacterium]